jgi:hypothetical protein
MTGNLSLFNGWRLTGALALVVAAMALGLAAWHGFSVEGVRVAIRATARTSLGLFVLVFAAAGWVRLWPSLLSGWVQKNRRYLGVSFAASHAMHAIVIAAFAILDLTQFRSVTSITSFAFGGVAYLFIAGMTATSFDRTAAWIGPRAWNLLHTAGMYYIWMVFMISEGMRAVGHPAYWLGVALLLVAMGVRQGSRLKRAVPAVA